MTDTMITYFSSLIQIDPMRSIKHYSHASQLRNLPHRLYLALQCEYGERTADWIFYKLHLKRLQYVRGEINRINPNPRTRHQLRHLHAFKLEEQDLKDRVIVYFYNQPYKIYQTRRDKTLEKCVRIAVF